MSFQSLMVHEFTVARPGTKAGRGADVVADWSTATRTPARGWFNQLETADVRPDNDGQRSEWLLTIEPDTDVAAGDRIEWRGFTLEVDGTPAPKFARAVLHHHEVRLRMVNG